MTTPCWDAGGWTA
jgi:hypothetical protein